MGFKQCHFVLVHGIVHGAWCWVKIVHVLEKAGHRVTALDLASAGDNTDMAADDISSLEQYNRPLEDLFASFPDEEKDQPFTGCDSFLAVVLVGHSLGGMSLTRMSELYPKKISVAVYISAFMPAPGQDINGLRESDSHFVRADFELKYNSKVGGGPTTSIELPSHTLQNYFYNKCSPEDFAFAVDRFKRGPVLQNMCMPVHGTEENYGRVPKVYILSKFDRAIDPYSARKMIALNPPNEVYEIDADHSAFFSGVEDVEKILIESAAKYDP